MSARRMTRRRELPSVTRAGVAQFRPCAAWAGRVDALWDRYARGKHRVNAIDALEAALTAPDVYTYPRGVTVDDEWALRWLACHLLPEELGPAPGYEEFGPRGSRWFTYLGFNRHECVHLIARLKAIRDGVEVRA